MLMLFRKPEAEEIESASGKEDEFKTAGAFEVSDLKIHVALIPGREFKDPGFRRVSVFKMKMNGTLVKIGLSKNPDL